MALRYVAMSARKGDVELLVESWLVARRNFLGLDSWLGLLCLWGATGTWTSAEHKWSRRAFLPFRQKKKPKTFHELTGPADSSERFVS